MTASRFTVGGITTVGVNPHRASNDDYLLIDRDLGLVAVFDAGGSWAEMARRAGPVSAEAISRVIRNGADEEPRALIERAFRAATDALLAEPDENGWCGGASVADIGQQRRIAFAIAVKISREGTEGHHLFENVEPANIRAINLALSRAEERVAKILNA